VSDVAGQELVLDFNAYRNDEGRFSRSRIVAAALRRPWSRVPGLMQLDRHSKMAAESLGEFLVDCRF
ncbi:hypothetical protein NL533_31800, partial [Klebsiella pneumoniae]|nr:hypothetical protein [Klebsiella pneumoniae]